MFLGLASSVIAFSEFLVHLEVAPPIVHKIASTFSIDVIESNPSLSVISSFFLGLLPMIYLINKKDMSCEECGADFSLESLGRFYNSKERVPITDEDGNEKDHYYEYDGYRILECQECGSQYKEGTRWDDR